MSSWTPILRHCAKDQNVYICLRSGPRWRTTPPRPLTVSLTVKCLFCLMPSLSEFDTNLEYCGALENQRKLFLNNSVSSFFGTPCMTCFHVYDVNNLNHQVVTVLKDTTKLVTEVPFPSLTLCGSGVHMNNVEKKLVRTSGIGVHRTRRPARAGRQSRRI